MGSIALIYENDSEIIAEYCESKSSLAANSLIRKYQSFVYSIALRYLNNHHDAEDVSQDVFIKALKNLDKFNQKSSLKTWLYSIAANTSKDFLRKKNLLKIFTFSKDNFPDIRVDNDFIDKLDKQEFNFRLLDFIKQLPERQREIFALRYFDDIPYKELSEQFNISVGSLKATYHIALKKIIKEFKENV